MHPVYGPPTRAGGRAEKSPKPHESPESALPKHLVTWIFGCPYTLAYPIPIYSSLRYLPYLHYLPCPQIVHQPPSDCSPDGPQSKLALGLNRTVIGLGASKNRT